MTSAQTSKPQKSSQQEIRKTHEVAPSVLQQASAMEAAPPRAALQRAVADPRTARPPEILALQHTYGNQAVQRLLTDPHRQAEWTVAPDIQRESLEEEFIPVADLQNPANQFDCLGKEPGTCLTVANDDAPMADQGMAEAADPQGLDPCFGKEPGTCLTVAENNAPQEQHGKFLTDEEMGTISAPRLPWHTKIPILSDIAADFGAAGMIATGKDYNLYTGEFFEGDNRAQEGLEGAMEVGSLVGPGGGPKSAASLTEHTSKLTEPLVEMGKKAAAWAKEIGLGKKEAVSEAVRGALEGITSGRGIRKPMTKGTAYGARAGAAKAIDQTALKSSKRKTIAPRPTKTSEGPVAETIVEKLSEALSSGKSRAILVGGVLFENVLVSKKGTTMAVEYLFIENLYEVPGRGRAMQVALEQAAIQVAKAAGAKEAQVIVRSVINPKWGAYLKSLGYTETIIRKTGYDFPSDWTKVLPLGK